MSKKAPKRVSKKSVPNSSRVAQNIKTKKRKKKAKRVLYSFLFILGVMGLVTLALSPVFKIKGIVVKGEKVIEQKAILNSANFLIGKNAFASAGNNFIDNVGLSFKNAEMKIASENPYIKSVNITYQLNGYLNINIIEKLPFAVLSGKYNGKNVKLLIDDQYYVLENKYNESWNKYLFLQNFKISNTNAGNCAVNSIEPRNAIANEFIKCTKDNVIALNSVVKKIDSIAVDNENNVVFRINKVDVIFGNFEKLSVAEKRYKFEYLSEILSKISDARKGVLDFSLGKDAVFKPGKQINLNGEQK